MNNKHYHTGISAITLLITAAVMLFTLAAGCKGAWPSQVSQEEADPFYKDRVATIRIVMDEQDWEYCLENAYDEQYVVADFWFDDEVIPGVGVRPKGNSSLGQTISFDSPRIPLAVDFNIFNRARNFYGLKKVVLNNGWSDPTLIREVLAYEIFAAMDIPTPRSSHVDVWVNDHHLGVYTMAESVDATFLARHFDNPGGNLYKPEMSAARLDWTEEDAERDINTGLFAADIEHHDPVLYTNIGGAPFITLLRALGQEESVAAYEHIEPPEGNIARGFATSNRPETLIEAAALKTNENSPDHTALFRLLDVLNNEPDETFPEEIEKVLDVDEVLRYIAVSAVILHLDNYIGAGHNIYLYEQDGKFTVIPWDCNMAFATFNCGMDKEGLINYYIDEPTASAMARFPLVERLLTYEPYLETYHGYVRDVIEGPFKPANLIPRIDEAAELIRPYAETDTEMFYTVEDCIRCLDEDLRSSDSVQGWQAGGAMPQMPWIGRIELNCLKDNFDIVNLWNFFGMDLSPQDIDKIKSCLTEEHFIAFRQALFGPADDRQQPRMQGFGPNALGLKPFVIERYESVKGQLAGEIPGGPGNGTGNGVTRGMCAGGL